MKLKHLQRLNIRDFFKNEQAVCVVREMHAAPSNAYIAMHDHEFSEIAIVARGALTHIHPKGTVRLTAGDFFVIHPGVRHGFADLAKDTIVKNCLYNPDNPPPGLWTLPPDCRPVFFPGKGNSLAGTVTGSLSAKDLGQALMLVDMIQAERKSRRPYVREIETNLFSGLLLLLARNQPGGSTKTHAVIRGELDYIVQHLDRRVTLKELCGVAGRSAATLNRLFRDEVGLSPCAYALHRRLDKARSLLADEHLTLSAVAQETGFFDASHLSRALQSD